LIDSFDFSSHCAHYMCCVRSFTFAAKESSLIFLAGSHNGEWYLPTTFLSEQAKWFPEGSLTPVPDIDADPSSFNLLQWAVEPGDALAFHMLTLHGSKGSTDLRRAFSVRVTGDDMVHAPRAWRTSPECDHSCIPFCCMHLVGAATLRPCTISCVCPTGAIRFSGFSLLTHPFDMCSGSRASRRSCRRGGRWTTGISRCSTGRAEAGWVRQRTPGAADEARIERNSCNSCQVFYPRQRQILTTTSCFISQRRQGIVHTRAKHAKYST
jgi:hypothetical protein